MRLRSRPRPFPIATLSAALLLAGVTLTFFMMPANRLAFAAIDLANAHQPPWFFAGDDARFPLGTDGQGRSLDFAIVAGIRTSLLVALSAVVLATGVGLLLGFLAATRCRWLDIAVMRFAELQQALPPVAIALLLGTLWPPAAAGEFARVDTFWISVVSIALAAWPEFALTVRTSSLSLRQQDYVAAAVVLGGRPATILCRHIWPGVRPALLTLAACYLPRAIAVEATLSYLGIGQLADTPTLGAMIRTGQAELVSGRWWCAGLPLLTLVIICVLATAAADEIRDAFEPHLSQVQDGA